MCFLSRQKVSRLLCVGSFLLAGMFFGICSDSFGLLRAAASPADGNPGYVRIQDVPEWQVSTTKHGGKLLLSDSPEMVERNGILYQDTVSGPIRLFFHHVNNMPQVHKLSVVLENNGKLPAQVLINRKGLAGQGREDDWTGVGTRVQERYLSEQQSEILNVPAQGAVILDETIEQMVLDTGELINGMYDFTTDQPLTVKVLMAPLAVDSIAFASYAPVLEPDQYKMRGTFNKPDRILFPKSRYSSSEEVVAITLADNDLDQYLEGIDATNGEKVINYGNYGVVYRLYIPPMPGKGAYVYLNPRGGSYSGFIGVSVNHRQEDIVATPGNNPHFGSNACLDFAFLGPQGRGQSMWLTFSPPGASNLPVKLVFFSADNQQL